MKVLWFLEPYMIKIQIPQAFTKDLLNMNLASPVLSGKLLLILQDHFKPHPLRIVSTYSPRQSSIFISA